MFAAIPGFLSRRHIRISRTLLSVLFVLPLVSACSGLGQSNVSAGDLSCDVRYTSCSQNTPRPLHTDTKDIATIPEFPPVLFDFDRYQTTLPDLQPLADYLQKNTGLNITLNGYADPFGSPSYNLTLSEQRAAFIRQALVQQGISTDRILIKGHGSVQADTDPALQRPEQIRRFAPLRRVEFKFISVTNISE